MADTSQFKLYPRDTLPMFPEKQNFETPSCHCIQNFPAFADMAPDKDALEFRRADFYR
jgi:hypothetical protein